MLEAQRRKLEAGDGAPTPGGPGAGGGGAQDAGGSGAGTGAGGAEPEVPALAEVDAGMLLRVYEAIK